MRGIWLLKSGDTWSEVLTRTDQEETRWKSMNGLLALVLQKGI